MKCDWLSSSRDASRLVASFPLLEKALSRPSLLSEMVVTGPARRRTSAGVTCRLCTVTSYVCEHHGGGTVSRRSSVCLAAAAPVNSGTAASAKLPPCIILATCGCFRWKVVDLMVGWLAGWLVDFVVIGQQFVLPPTG